MKIGTVELPGVVCLAPMAGVTDFAFRRLCRACGAALTTTEMVSARALVYNDSRSRELLYIPEDETPAAVQIFGHEPEIMAEAAQIALEISHAAILDINMGCPVGKIVKSGDGSALMKTPELAAKIIEAVCRNVSVPVTVKFRKGWDNGSVNAVEFAGICEQAGASALTVHGRTRAQLYTGRADREIIRDVKKAVSIPVTGNGDIFSGEDAARMMQSTGCDMVMIGRGCFGDPWLFARANAAIRGESEPELPPLNERMDAAVRQIEELAVQRGERAACLEARHQLPWYLHGVPYSGVYRQQLVRVETLEEIRRIASEIRRDRKFFS
ncbi:MAG: tRNA dihydrouridine synthase DusB [Candidatus Limivicinus sp.]|jgi:tRNA-dihydrouridine synthase B